jgi:uncharacterized protein YbaA (DUF1428 family)
MAHYIDGFVLPVPRAQLDEYKDVVARVAEVWQEHGALSYAEFVSDGSALDGLRAFTEFAGAKDDETIIFGWVVFDSREARDQVNERVAKDPRMTEIIEPLTRSPRPIFDAGRMVYGGFQSLVQLPDKSAG